MFRFISHSDGVPLFMSMLMTYGEWQAESASLKYGESEDYTRPVMHPVRSWGPREQPFSVIHEFDSWRKSPELAEAVAAIKALTAVIQRSEASTMMGLEVELKTASDALKVAVRPVCELAYFKIAIVLIPYWSISPLSYELLLLILLSILLLRSTLIIWNDESELVHMWMGKRWSWIKEMTVM